MDTGLETRLSAIRERMAAACARAGRDPSSVNLLAVSKTYGPEAVCAAAALGVEVFGENKVQEARGKVPQCPARLRWHLVGHLQTNKAREAVNLFEMIHAVDSLRLLQFLDRVAGEEGRTVNACVEVNVSGERSKFGIAPAELPGLLRAADTLFRVRIVGLMTMPPIAADPGETRPFFRALRELRDRMQSETGLALPELSMGMSHDYEVAIEEGATWIRIGTLLFGPRARSDAHDEG